MGLPNFRGNSPGDSRGSFRGNSTDPTTSWGQRRVIVQRAPARPQWGSLGAGVSINAPIRTQPGFAPPFRNASSSILTRVT